MKYILCKKVYGGRPLATADSIDAIRKKAMDYMREHRSSEGAYSVQKLRILNGSGDIVGSVELRKVNLKDPRAVDYKLKNGLYIGFEYWPISIDDECYYFIKKDGTLGIRMKKGADGKYHANKKGTPSNFKDYHWYVGQ